MYGLIAGLFLTVWSALTAAPAAATPTNPATLTDAQQGYALKYPYAILVAFDPTDATKVKKVSVNASGELVVAGSVSVGGQISGTVSINGGTGTAIGTPFFVRQSSQISGTVSINGGTGTSAGDPFYLGQPVQGTMGIYGARVLAGGAGINTATVWVGGGLDTNQNLPQPWYATAGSRYLAGNDGINGSQLLQWTAASVALQTAGASGTAPLRAWSGTPTARGTAGFVQLFGRVNDTAAPAELSATISGGDTVLMVKDVAGGGGGSTVALNNSGVSATPWSGTVTGAGHVGFVKLFGEHDAAGGAIALTATSYFVSGTAATQHAGMAGMVMTPATRKMGTTGSATEYVDVMGGVRHPVGSSFVGQPIGMTMFPADSVAGNFALNAGVQFLASGGTSAALGFPVGMTFPLYPINGWGSSTAMRHVGQAATLMRDSAGTIRNAATPSQMAADFRGDGGAMLVTGTTFQGTAAPAGFAAHVAVVGADASASVLSYSVSTGATWPGATVAIESGTRAAYVLLSPLASATAHVGADNVSMARAATGVAGGLPAGGVIQPGIWYPLRLNATGVAETWYFDTRERELYLTVWKYRYP